MASISVNTGNWALKCAAERNIQNKQFTLLRPYSFSANKTITYLCPKYQWTCLLHILNFNVHFNTIIMWFLTMIVWGYASSLDRFRVSPDRKHAMTMKFHETVTALLSFISTYIHFPYISVTFACKCFEWIAVFVSSKTLKFLDGLRVLATLFCKVATPSHLWIIRYFTCSIQQISATHFHMTTKFAYSQFPTPSKSTLFPFWDWYTYLHHPPPPTI